MKKKHIGMKVAFHILKIEIMDKDLYEWLRSHFMRDNHPKYRKYFDEWVSNVTEKQLVGFQHDMELETIFIKAN